MLSTKKVVMTFKSDNQINAWNKYTFKQIIQSYHRILHVTLSLVSLITNRQGHNLFSYQYTIIETKYKRFAFDRESLDEINNSKTSHEKHKIVGIILHSKSTRKSFSISMKHKLQLLPTYTKSVVYSRASYLIILYN